MNNSLITNNLTTKKRKSLNANLPINIKYNIKKYFILFRFISFRDENHV